MGKKVLIVGGVAGGASCAARLRRLDETAEITLFERGEYISFANCGLPYYVGNVIEDREELLLQTPEEMKSNFNIDVKINHEVVSIERGKKQITVRNLNDDTEYTDSYDVLVLATGSSPLRPKSIPGIDAPNIFTVWNIPDVDRIKKRIQDIEIRDIVVIGGGFIGLEMAENMHRCGYNVTVVDLLDQIMATVDRELAQVLQKDMLKNGVNLMLGEKVNGFVYDAEKDRTVVSFESGRSAAGEIVVLSMGVRPNNELAKECGLELGARGGIVTDAHMRTSDPSIYATGDVCENMHFVTRKAGAVPLAGPANRQGRIAADNIAGIESVYGGVQGSFVAQVFDYTVAGTGLSQQALEKDGYELVKDFYAVSLNPFNHAGYYPGADMIYLKLMFDSKDGRILGAQAVGTAGVEKRIDVIAMAMRCGIPANKLTEVELCYAPPYSSPKDPVNMAGYVAENIMSGRMKIITWKEVCNRDVEKTVIVDVRTKEEFDEAQNPDAVLVPLGELRNRAEELPRDKQLLIYCKTGVRAWTACAILTHMGYDVKNIAGGMETYFHI